MEIIFGDNARSNAKVKRAVEQFLERVTTLEAYHEMPIIILQDGVNKSHYIKCSVKAKEAVKLCDLDAKLDTVSSESYRANRELLTKNTTYLKMELDAAKGREFNDIIVEYNTTYNPNSPLKVWGGQHRTSAISKVEKEGDRYHGFRVYFELSKEQRTDLALVSNTNIAVSNDTFDRMVEETLFGQNLRTWCQRVGFLQKDEDFPDIGSRSEVITVKKARSFIVNFYLGKKQGEAISTEDLDSNVYEPHLPSTGVAGAVTVDPIYAEAVNDNDILNDEALLRAGRSFVALHTAQQKAVLSDVAGIPNKKGYRNKALNDSIISGWSYIAGLLQSHTLRLENHYKLPKTNSKVPDPLNADEMSKYKHEWDDPTYRGLGTRSALKDRQRVAQLFLAKSSESKVALDKRLMDKAVSQVFGIQAFSKGYSKK